MPADSKLHSPHGHLWYAGGHLPGRAHKEEFPSDALGGSHGDRKRCISLVAPCYNEEEVLPHFLERVGSLFKEVEADYLPELILVDDGSGLPHDWWTPS